MQQLPNMDASYGNPIHQANTMHQDMPDANAQSKQILEMCKTYQYHFVQLEAKDGSVYEGIIEGTDDDHVVLLIPTGEIESVDNRQYPYGGYTGDFPLYGGGYPYGYGYPPYGVGYPYGYGYPRRFRRFRQRRFPLFGLRRLLFPFFY